MLHPINMNCNHNMLDNPNNITKSLSRTKIMEAINIIQISMFMLRMILVYPAHASSSVLGALYAYMRAVQETAFWHGYLDAFSP